MTTEELYKLGLSRVDRIRDEMKQFSQCDPDTLEECVSDAKAGLKNTIKEQFHPTVRLGLAEMKGEWTIRSNRYVNETEQEFASRFIGVLGEMITEEFDGTESY